MKKVVLLVLLFTPLLLQNCRKEDAANNVTAADTIRKPSLPDVPYNYVIDYPAHIRAALALTDNTPADNALTNEGATLGRVLFYDKNLSFNRSISCGSCHKQATSFDDAIALSKGFAGGLTDRNSMALLNLRFYKSGKMFWDERAATLEKQALGPIQNHVEMGLTLEELESRVQSLSYYPVLFQKAFGSPVIDSVRIAKAIAQFERSIVTYQAKYDQVKAGAASFTALEARGEQVFLQQGPGGAPACGGCHAPPMFLTSEPAAPFAFPLEAGINGQNRFKSGSLRNIGIRKSLFHNGSVADISAMLNSGAPGGGNVIPAHGIPPPDVNAVLAFLNTLTDETITTEQKFSDPFK